MTFISFNGMFNIWHLGEHQFILYNSVKENKVMHILNYYILYYIL
jgi:hypothetical protein